MQFTAEDATIRFVDSAFREEDTAAEIKQRFGASRSMTFTPMTLRTIFLALARDNRNRS